MFVCVCDAHSLAEPRGKVVKNEVWVGLGHGTDVRDVVPHYHVVECEVSGGAEWQVAHYQTICSYTGTPEK